MRSNLILTGGINHDFLDTAHAIAEVLAEAQFRSTIIDDLSAGFKMLDNSDFDLVTLFALRWRMLDDDKYIPDRARWAYEISDRDRHILSDHVINGGGLLGLHTAAICFDTWPEWPELLGAAWVWRETFHPPPAELLVRKAGDHAVSSILQYLLQEERIGFSRKPGGAVVTDETIGNARQVTTAKMHLQVQKFSRLCAGGTGIGRFSDGLTLGMDADHRATPHHPEGRVVFIDDPL